MELNTSERKRLLTLYKSLIHYYCNNEQRNMTYDDKPYTNFLAAVHEHVSKSDCYDSDLMEFVIEKHIQKIEEIPKEFDINMVTELIDGVIKTFKINVGTHYLIIPIPKAGLKSSIQFRNFALIPRQLDREDKINAISKITHISSKELENDFKHTETSRSPDFLLHNLLIIKVNNQTSYVTLNAERIAEYCIYFLRIIYFSEVHQVTDSIINIFRFPYEYRENSHIAILSKDGWRKRHASLWFEAECDFDLDFISEAKYQSMFIKLVNSFIFNRNSDDFTLKFLNGIILFNKSYEQKLSNDDSLKLLLLITAGESLLTQSRNEKKLRLAALLSRLVKVKGCKQHEVAKIIQVLYLKRNDFVHAGKNVYLPYKSEEEGLNELRVLRYLIAKLLLNYVKVYNIKIKPDSNKNRYDKWVEYLDDVFDNIITGKKRGK